jgi:hypothetical protein
VKGMSAGGALVAPSAQSDGQLCALLSLQSMISVPSILNSVHWLYCWRGVS